MSTRKIDLSGSQVVAGVLATLTAAIATSYLGVAGTLIGAAAVSVISTAGGAIYQYSLRRTSEKLRTAGPVVLRRANIHGAAERPGASGDAQAGAQGRDVAQTRSSAGQGRAWWQGGPDAATDGLPAPGQLGGGHKRTPPQAANGRRHPRWLMLTVTAAAIFAAVIGGITVIEKVAGKPLASIIWHKAGSGTTVGTVVDGNNPQPTSPATVSPQPSGTSATMRQTPTPSGSPSASPDASPDASPSLSGPESPPESPSSSPFASTVSSPPSAPPPTGTQH